MSTDITPLFRLCSHSAQGFAFEHPASWEKVYSPRYVVYPADALKVISPSITLLSPCIAVIVATIDLLVTLEAAYAEFVTKHIAENKGFLVQQAPITLSTGDKAIEYTYHVTNASKEWQAIRVSAIKDGQLWVIDGSCLQADWTRWQPTLEKTVRSLRLL